MVGLKFSSPLFTPWDTGLGGRTRFLRRIFTTKQTAKRGECDAWKNLRFAAFFQTVAFREQILLDGERCRNARAAIRQDKQDEQNT